MTPLIFATLAFAAGTAAGLRAALPAAALLFGVAVLAASALVQTLGTPAPARAARDPKSPQPPHAPGPAGRRDPHAVSARRSVLASMLLFAAAGFVSAAAASQRTRADCRARFVDGATLSVRGVLEGTPSADAGGWLRLESVRAGTVNARCGGTVRVTLPARLDAKPAAGSRISASGRWWAFPVDGVWPVPPERRGTLGLQHVRVLGSGSRGHPLVHLRGAAQVRLRRLFPERSGLAEALLIAQRGGLDATVRMQFAASGLTHLLSISGTHVGLVAGVLLLITGVLRLPGAWGAVAAASGTVAYVIFLGAPHAAARAALQILLLLAARLTQRPSDPYTLLACAALVLLVVDPLALLDAGFQLSFAGIFGLLALRRPLLAKLPRRWPTWLKDGLASGTAATVATTPIAALHFGLVAVVGVVANLAAIPLVGLCVPAVALALLPGSVIEGLGAFFASGADLLLVALMRTAAVAAAVPFGHAYVSRAAVLGWLAAAGSALLAVGWLREHGGFTQRRSRLLVSGGVAAGCAVLVAWPSATRGSSEALEIHAIDVGQGDAYAIRSPAGRWLLVDAGPRSEDFDAGRARVVPFLLRNGVSRVDAVILTHPHTDHVGGVEALIDAIDVGVILDPAIPEANEAYARTIARARRAGVRWHAAREGRELRVGDMVIRFLAPLERVLDAPGDPNDYSVVFRLGFGRFGALFTGDAPAHVENELVAQHGGAMDVDVLKVGHHGSRTSTGDSLLDVATPQLALISAGRRNRYGHPTPEVIARLARHGVRVLRTDKDGTVTVRARADGGITVSATR